MKAVMRPMLLLAVLALGLATAAQAGEMKTIRSALGAEIRVPGVVPDRDRCALAGEVPIDGALAVLLYADPEHPQQAEYAEAYDLTGNLLWIAWYDAEGTARLAADESLTSPGAEGAPGTLGLRAISGPVI